MEVCILSIETPCPDINSISGSLTELSNSTHSKLKDLAVNGVKAHLNEFLSKEDSEISTISHNPSPGKNKGDIVGEDDCEDFGNIKSDNSASEKWLSESVAVTALGKPKFSDDGLSNEGRMWEDDKVSDVKCCAKPVDQGHSQSMSRPTTPKLVSAMKGSRERQGIPPKELSVRWAPDVYDPTPTSVSHVPSNRNQRYCNNGKKYGKKNKQKNSGKSSRGSKGKDKKHGQKNNISPANESKPLHDKLLVGFDEPEVSDFNIVNPDPSCGSSFLKNSITSIQCPVTEAK